MGEKKEVNHMYIIIYSPLLNVLHPSRKDNSKTNIQKYSSTIYYIRIICFLGPKKGGIGS